MDKIELTTKMVSEVIHEFHCDKCGVYLMRVPEFEDGYYVAPPYYQICHIKLKGHYCANCAREKIDKAKEILQEMGFEV